MTERQWQSLDPRWWREKVHPVLSKILAGIQDKSATNAIETINRVYNLHLYNEQVTQQHDCTCKLLWRFCEKKNFAGIRI